LKLEKERTMTVVTREKGHYCWCSVARGGDGYEELPCKCKRHCSFCEDPISFPFVEWQVFGMATIGVLVLVICPRCCGKLRRGLLADMNKAIALSDFKRAAIPPLQERVCQ
jgi:hypothetical protein